MRPTHALVGAFRSMSSALANLIDTVPPYRKIEGRLEAKEFNNNDSYFLLVESEIVQVDQLTFKALMEGEALRIRCTRGMRAIYIDRLTP